MGNDVDWSTQGAANNILDNLIATHQIRPMVVVMTNYNGIPGGTNGYRLDLINSMVPAIEEQFRVNRDPDQRAFAGLSAGGGRALNILFNSPETFGFVGLWSMAGTAPPLTDPAWENPALEEIRGIHIGCGFSDGLITRTYDLMDKLTTNEIPYYTNLIPGCHTWFVWRDNLRDFLTTILFKIN
jgi:enterochelin esterase-like enzyme